MSIDPDTSRHWITSAKLNARNLWNASISVPNNLRNSIRFWLRYHFISINRHSIECLVASSIERSTATHFNRLLFSFSRAQFRSPSLLSPTFGIDRLFGRFSFSFRVWRRRWQHTRRQIRLLLFYPFTLIEYFDLVCAVCRVYFWLSENCPWNRIHQFESVDSF